MSCENAGIFLKIVTFQPLIFGFVLSLKLALDTLKAMEKCSSIEGSTVVNGLAIFIEGLQALFITDLLNMRGARLRKVYLMALSVESFPDRGRASLARTHSEETLVSHEAILGKSVVLCFRSVALILHEWNLLVRMKHHHARVHQTDPMLFQSLH